MSTEFSPLYQEALRPAVPAAHPSLVGPMGALKRMFDLVLAMIALVLLMPVMLAIALAVRLDSPGPVLFRQQRVGLGGRVFWMYKFRSMSADAERRHAELLPFNEVTDGVIFKMTHDPRVTRLGRFLRRTSLDELPQLFNVLRRDMSLIGPRPLPVYEVDLTDPDQARRLLVMPGCTGLWQVSGRSQLTSFRAMVELDLAYIRDWSLATDARILGATFGAVLQARGSC